MGSIKPTRAESKSSKYNRQNKSVDVHGDRKYRDISINLLGVKGLG